MNPRPSLSRTWLPLVALAGAGFAQAQTTERVSVATGGAQGGLYSRTGSVSADGRYVAFCSRATNLVAGDTNSSHDVFVRDRQTGTTERVSLNSAGIQGNDASGFNGVSISADGRFVAFESDATNLVAWDTTGWSDIFVRDRLSGTTERVSVDSGGVPANSNCGGPSISADGRYVAFTTYASNLVAGDANGQVDVFVHDRQTGTTERASEALGGGDADHHSFGPSLSADGRYVAFSSYATNLVAGNTTVCADIFVRDRQSGTTELVSVDSAGVEANADTYYAAISADGRYVVFSSWASNLVAGDTNGTEDMFVHDRLLGTTERVSLDTAGNQANGRSEIASISADGRVVAFQSDASNLVGGDTNGVRDVFVRDRQSATTVRVSLDSSGSEGNQYSGDTGGFPGGVTISASGRFVAFVSLASNLVAGDTNGVLDMFVHDRDVTGFSIQCEPGTGGVIACPCANPPSGAGRGCDNSAGTGGASLSASGVAYLSSDTLVFTTSGERPTATSIVLQCTGASSTGFVFGQGVRCSGGNLKRLYVHNAVGGSISAPTGADLPVSARSAALGDPIGAGTSRYYGVYYRDPIVLGGCPATSTFNITQGGSVLWQP